MRARIAGETEDRIGVQVWDNEGREHRVKITPDGDVKLHEQDAFPLEAEQRSPEEEEVIQQVRLRAKYAAHFETHADALAPDWDPEVLEEAIEVLEGLDASTFNTHFREYFHEVQEPSVDVPLEHVQLITKGLRIERGRLADTGPVLYLVEDASGDLSWHGGKDTADSNVILNVPPLEIDFPFGERFREYLVHHLKCQIRDIFDRMGEHPPEEYQVDGFGKLVVEEEGGATENRQSVRTTPSEKQ